jgi:hypothetical protein
MTNVMKATSAKLFANQGKKKVTNKSSSSSEAFCKTPMSMLRAQAPYCAQRARGEGAIVDDISGGSCLASWKSCS